MYHSDTMAMSKQRLAEITAIPDEDIDTSDIPELGDHFWANAKVVMPVQKKAISLRVDEDIHIWFKPQGRGYQTRMNAVLRAYMEAPAERGGNQVGG